MQELNVMGFWLTKLSMRMICSNHAFHHLMSLPAAQKQYPVSIVYKMNNSFSSPLSHQSFLFCFLCSVFSTSTLTVSLFLSPHARQCLANNFTVENQYFPIKARLQDQHTLTWHFRALRKTAYRFKWIFKNPLFIMSSYFISSLSEWFGSSKWANQL